MEPDAVKRADERQVYSILVGQTFLSASLDEWQVYSILVGQIIPVRHGWMSGRCTHLPESSHISSCPLKSHAPPDAAPRPTMV